MQTNIKKVQSMKNLVLSVTNYLDYIISLGFKASVHFANEILEGLPAEIFDSLLPYNIHTNPYCMWVKKCDNNCCIKSQQSLILEGKSGIRICHAGVKEFILHFYKGGAPAGIISVSGYRENSFNSKNMSLWEESLNDGEIPSELLTTLLTPLAIMLEKLVENESSGEGNEYNRILIYLNEYYMSADLESICRHFHRSPSHISHLFKKQTGMTIRAYCNKLKLEKAKKILETTDTPITNIAFDTGFNDVSYFINLFRRKYGLSPMVYRKSIDKKNSME